ncbi:MSMEG_0570 family nitrogen starvation response protein [Cellulomonas dongxiuzhuiae]|uniref:MSMEG_0570 family nitrogen starvation response protein n=1 Tax=Cellulomonas dongxiuzhuiae TaxID=2819979 RepID=UPI001AAE820A|nr:MSMEG_0570 family nitrogen starvation response protein [Cellulomonas dongxiuzhuiae]MBO3087146.1 MSMEG_0570 family nitrogen starvation response protein [Cellulomonas dongxiuzhuiae]
MPEMTFEVRWPDGTATACYSPSLVVWDHLEVGADYPVAELVARTSRALAEASDRVRERYGLRCTSAARQQAQIEELAARFDPGAPVRVVRMVPPLPGPVGGAVAGTRAGAA